MRGYYQARVHYYTKIFRKMICNEAVTQTQQLLEKATKVFARWWKYP